MRADSGAGCRAVLPLVWASTRLQLSRYDTNRTATVSHRSPDAILYDGHRPGLRSVPGPQAAGAHRGKRIPDHAMEAFTRAFKIAPCDGPLDILPRCPEVTS